MLNRWMLGLGVSTLLLVPIVACYTGGEEDSESSAAAFEEEDVDEVDVCSSDTGYDEVTPTGETMLTPQDRPRPPPKCKPGCEARKPYTPLIGGTSFPKNAPIGSPCTLTCQCSSAPNGDRCKASPPTAQGKVKESYGVKYCHGSCGGKCVKG